MLSCIINLGITFLRCAAMSVCVRSSCSSLAQTSSAKQEKWMKSGIPILGDALAVVV